MGRGKADCSLGPWRVDRRDTVNGSIVYMVIDADENMVAVVDEIDRAESRSDLFARPNLGRARADAELIARAPSMQAELDKLKSDNEALRRRLEFKTK